jgi:hypothetical protein
VLAGLTLIALSSGIVREPFDGQDGDVDGLVGGEVGPLLVADGRCRGK